MTAATEALDMAASHECSVAVSGSMLKLRAPEKPPAEVLDQLRQHKFDIIGHLLGVQVEWAEGLAKIEAMPAPLDWPDHRWPATVGGACKFVQTWGGQASALGWSAIELFGCHPSKPYARLECIGLALSLASAPVLALTAKTARVGQATFYRTHPVQLEPAILIWEI